MATINNFRIEKKILADLKPADWNPRKISDHDMAALEKSIEQWGLVEPIIVNERTGHIVGGHQRFAALWKKGIQETEVIVVDIAPEQEKGLNLALNRIHGEWDYELLSNLFKELTEIEFDLSLTGFAEYEITPLLGANFNPSELQPLDEGESKNKEVTCPKCGEKFVP